MQFLKDKFCKDFADKSSGFTLGDAAKEIGMSKATLSRIRNGMMPERGWSCAALPPLPSPPKAE